MTVAKQKIQTSPAWRSFRFSAGAKLDGGGQASRGMDSRAGSTPVRWSPRCVPAAMKRRWTHWIACWEWLFSDNICLESWKMRWNYETPCFFFFPGSLRMYVLDCKSWISWKSYLTIHLWRLIPDSPFQPQCLWTAWMLPYVFVAWWKVQNLPPPQTEEDIWSSNVVDRWRGVCADHCVGHDIPRCPDDCQMWEHVEIYWEFLFYWVVVNVTWWFVNSNSDQSRLPETSEFGYFAFTKDICYLQLQLQFHVEHIQKSPSKTLTRTKAGNHLLVSCSPR